MTAGFLHDEYEDESGDEIETIPGDADSLSEEEDDMDVDRFRPQKQAPKPTSMDLDDGFSSDDSDIGAPPSNRILESSSDEE